MPNLSIEVFKKPGKIASRDWLSNEAEGLKMQWIARNGLAEPPQWIQNVYGDLGSGRFWGVFVVLQGPTSYSADERYREQQKESLELAKKTFTNEELAAILELAVRSALNPFKDSMLPGTYMGHDVLYTEIFEKPGSFLSIFATDDIRKVLNNGRFWELLPDMKGFLNHGYSGHRIADVLTNYYDDLDLELVRGGLRLFERQHNPGAPFDFEGLSTENADRFGAFIKKIDTNRARLGISRSRLAPLVGPYVACIASASFDEDEYARRPRFEDFATRIKDPWVVEYLRESESVRILLAEQLMSEGVNRRDGGCIELVAQVIKALPVDCRVFEAMAGIVGMSVRSYADKNDFGRMIDDLREYGVDPDIYFEEKSQKHYKEYQKEQEERKSRAKTKRRSEV